MNSDNRPLWKKLVSIVLPLLGLIFVADSSYSLYKLARRGDVLVEQRQKLKEMEKRQEELKKQLSESYTPFFIEEEARNKLGLVKPGETLVYLEKESTDSGLMNSSQPSGEIEEEPDEIDPQQLQPHNPILQSWKALFF